MGRNKNAGRIELLAPGGSKEAVRMAVTAGADAVYTGGSMFGARAFAQNADTDTLLELMDFCHLHGARLYLTVNTLLKEQEIEDQLLPFLEPLYRRGLDAVLVQDFGVLRLLRRELPALPVHASTQMSVSSVAGAKMLGAEGVSRIVLARELTLPEIAEIADQTGLEIETFIHGALCYCYSGQCLMSSMIGGRSGNRGRCAQPCRQPYRLGNRSKSQGGPCRGKEERYLLSLKDICTLEILPELIAAGITTFKIEGRMKRPEYAAGVTAIYRRYIDRILAGETPYAVSPDDLRDLMDLYNRGGFSKGFYQTVKGPDLMAMDRSNHSGTNAAVLQSGKGRWKALEDLHADDQLELPKRSTSGEGYGNPADQRKKTGSSAWQICPGRAVGRGESFLLKNTSQMPSGSMLRRVRNEELLREIRTEHDPSRLKIHVNGRFWLRMGARAALHISCSVGGEDYSVNLYGEAAQSARTEGGGLKSEDIKKHLRKSGQTDFVFDRLEVDLEDGLFYPVSGLNALRREALEQLREKILLPFFRPLDWIAPQEAERSARQGGSNTDGAPPFTASAETIEQAQVLLSEDFLSRIYLDYMLFLGENQKEAYRIAKAIRDAGMGCFLMLPPVWRSKTREIFFSAFGENTARRFDGLLIRNFQQLGEAAFAGMVRISDESVYTWNHLAREQLAAWGIEGDTVPSECNVHELRMRGCRGSEIPVYGREVLMTTTSCIRKNTVGCTRDSLVLPLRDRTGAVFPVRCLCGICANRIYNSMPLDLSPYAQEIADLAPSAVRLRFTIEDRKETIDVCRRMQTMFQEKTLPMPASTRGHFRRGVD